MNKYLLLPLLILTLVACSPQGLQPTESMPNVSVPLNVMNKEMVLRESLGMLDIFEAIGTLDFYLENLSDGPISFNPDFGSKILIRTENGWESIENDFHYTGAGTVLPVKEQYPPGLVISVKPVLIQKPGPVVLRVIVVGTMIDTGATVGAYLDVVIE